MKRTVIWVIIGLVALAAVTAALIIVPIMTHTSAGSSGQEKPTGFVSSVAATGADGRTRILEAFDQNGEPADLEHMVSGDVITARGTGYDSAIGIYVSFCKVPDEVNERPTPCLGGVPADAQEEKSDDISDQELESAWVTDNWAWRAFASHTYEDSNKGSFEVRLVVPQPSGEGVDCTVEKCGLFTRADHTALDDRVQDIYLPIDFKN